MASHPITASVTDNGGLNQQQPHQLSNYHYLAPNENNNYYEHHLSAMHVYGVAGSNPGMNSEMPVAGAISAVNAVAAAAAAAAAGVTVGGSAGVSACDGSSPNRMNRSPVTSSNAGQTTHGKTLSICHRNQNRL